MSKIEQLNGLHFFMMSEGEYSDYCLGGLYVSDKEITEEEWYEFCKKESEIRDEKRKQFIGDAVYSPYDYSKNTEYYRRTDQYSAWVGERGYMEEIFAKEKGLVKVAYQELHLDY